MRRLLVPVLLSVLLLGFGVSCEKMTTASNDADQMAPLSDLPASYGKLISVTSGPLYPGWYQLWFEDSMGTIRIVRVHMVKNLMHKQVKVINRMAGM